MPNTDSFDLTIYRQLILLKLH